MTNDTTVTDTTVTDTTATATPATPVVVPKAPSKKSLAFAIFAAKLADRKAGLFASNKAFRAAVLRTIETDLNVSTASAATMYNAAKTEAEAADASIGLGRDPKKEKAPAGTGKRGRPVGSKNKPAEVAPVAAEVVPVAAEVTAEVAPAGLVLNVEAEPVAEVAPVEAEPVAEVAHA